MNLKLIPHYFLVLSSSLAALVLVSQIVPFSLVVQVYLLGLGWIVFRSWPPFLRLLQKMPPPHALLFGMLLGAVMGGHFTLSTTRTYPFMSWAIFPMVDERNPVVCRELIGTTRSGKKVRLIMEQLFPSLIQYNFPPAHDGGSDFLTPTVQAAARMYDRLHPEDPVSEINLVKVSVPLHPSPDQPFPLCEISQTFSCTPYPSN